MPSANPVHKGLEQAKPVEASADEPGDTCPIALRSSSVLGFDGTRQPLRFQCFAVELSWFDVADDH